MASCTSEFGALFSPFQDENFNLSPGVHGEIGRGKNPLKKSRATWEGQKSHFTRIPISVRK